ncbi:MAG: hypothetical protein CMO66_06125 [Verrucomicrobiales bacterium]|nr:hypothetical protein [Verrucomicrobiales bacterium]
MSRDVISRYWFLAALILIIPVGLAWPGLGLYLKEEGGFIPVFVGAMLGIAGFSMDTSRLVQQATHFRAVLPVLASIYVAAPLAAYALSRIFAPEGDPHFLPAMMIMAAQAGSLASAIALTLMSGGNRELALICTLGSNSLTVLLTPFILEQSIDPAYIRELSGGNDLEFPLLKMIWKMVVCVLLPIAAGQLLRHWFWETTEKVRPVIRVVPQLIILLFVYTGFAAAATQLGSNAGIAGRFLVACMLLHLMLLGLNSVISGALNLSWADRTAVILSGSQKTLPNGIYIWGTFFAQNPYGAIPLVLYHLFQLVVDTLLVPWFEKKNSTVKREGDREFGCHSLGGDD